MKNRQQLQELPLTVGEVYRRTSEIEAMAKVIEREFDDAIADGLEHGDAERISILLGVLVSMSAAAKETLATLMSTPAVRRLMAG